MTRLKLKKYNSKIKMKTTRLTQILNYDSTQANFTMSSPPTAPKTCCDFRKYTVYRCKTYGCRPQRWSM